MSERKKIDFPRRFTVTAVTRTKTGTDPYGEAVYEDTRTDHKVVGWASPGATVTATDAEQGLQKYDLDLYADAGLLALGDAVEVIGTRYKVVGVKDYNHGPWAYTGLSVYELEVVK